jgi:act minimal PKS acyl carrier protein
MATLTIDDLRHILVECAGESEDINLSGDVMDVPFEQLGYDSLALIEAATRIQRTFGVSIPDGQVTELRTPRMLLSAVNGDEQPEA